MYIRLISKHVGFNWLDKSDDIFSILVEDEVLLNIMEQLINWYPCRSITGALLCGDITFGLWTLEVLYVPLCVWYHIYLIKIKGCDVYNFRLVHYLSYTKYLHQEASWWFVLAPLEIQHGRSSWCLMLSAIRSHCACS